MGLLLYLGFPVVFLLLSGLMSGDIDFGFIKPLLYLLTGKIEIFHNQAIYAIPKSFEIVNTRRNYSGLFSIANEKKKDLHNLAKYMEDFHHPANVYCDVYLTNRDQLVAQNSKVRIGWNEFPDYLLSDDYTKKSYRKQLKGSIVSIKNKENKTLHIFLQTWREEKVSTWDLLNNYVLQSVVKSHMQKQSINFIKNELGDPEVTKWVIFDVFSNFEEKHITSSINSKTEDVVKDTKNVLISKVCPNPEVMGKIVQIDKQINDGMCLTAVKNEQWESVVKPNLLNVVNHSKLNKENEKEINTILDSLSSGLKSKDEEFVNLEAEATLSAVRSYLEMNGCIQETS